MAAGIGLALAPVATDAARAQRSAKVAAADAVSYNDAMACSALFALLAGSLEGEPDGVQLLDMSEQWLVVAAKRARAAGVIANEAERQLWVTDLTMMLEDMNDDAISEEFLLNHIDLCEAKHQLIQDEFDS